MEEGPGKLTREFAQTVQIELVISFIATDRKSSETAEAWKQAIQSSEIPILVQYQQLRRTFLLSLRDRFAEFRLRSDPNDFE